VIVGEQLDTRAAEEIIENLRRGIPPKSYVSRYSTGHEAILRDIRKRHLESQATRGKIRFISGSWGSGKTHFLRLLREEAFEAGYLVSTIELSVDQVPFNKFEQVFFQIVREITSPEMYQRNDLNRAAPFGEVLRQMLFEGWAEPEQSVTHTRYEEAKATLFAAQDIDIDFRRMVGHYWETFLPEGGDHVALEDTRGTILQWFTGEGTIGSYRSKFGVQKVVNRANARLMLQSLSRFARLFRYRGIVILLDEAEMAHSTMRKSSLRQAHNNLLHLINSIDESDGLFLVYASTPDFFIDERYGIKVYGALAQRIGQPEERPPRAIDRVWNLDAIKPAPSNYAEAASRIRTIYVIAYPDRAEAIISDSDLRTRITELVHIHPEFSEVSPWRVVVTSTIQILDDSAEGHALRPVEQMHDDIMKRLKEQ